MSAAADTHPLILEGSELDDARSVAMWGFHDAAFGFRDCYLPGGFSDPGAGQDPHDALRMTCDLMSHLAAGSGYPEMYWPLTREDVATLESVARDEVDAPSNFDGEPAGVVAFRTERATVAARVLGFIDRLYAALPEPRPASAAARIR